MKAENIAYFPCSVKFDRTNLCGLDGLFSTLSPRAYAVLAAILTLLIIVVIRRITLRRHDRNSGNHKQQGQQQDTDFLFHFHSSKHFSQCVSATVLATGGFIPKCRAFCGQASTHWPHIMHSGEWDFATGSISMGQAFWQRPQDTQLFSSKCSLQILTAFSRP